MVRSRCELRILGDVDLHADFDVMLRYECECKVMRIWSGMYELLPVFIEPFRVSWAL